MAKDSLGDPQTISDGSLHARGSAPHDQRAVDYDVGVLGTIALQALLCASRQSRHSRHRVIRRRVVDVRAGGVPEGIVRIGGVTKAIMIGGDAPESCAVIIAVANRRHGAPWDKGVTGLTVRVGHAGQMLAMMGQAAAGSDATFQARHALPPYAVQSQRDLMQLRDAVETRVVSVERPIGRGHIKEPQRAKGRCSANGQAGRDVEAVG